MLNIMQINSELLFQRRYLALRSVTWGTMVTVHSCAAQSIRGMWSGTVFVMTSGESLTNLIRRS